MNKYKAKAIVFDGMHFHSIAEAARWRELLLLQKAGKIYHLKRQVRYKLAIEGRPILIRSEGFPNGRQAVYTADFSYVENDEIVVEEFKGRDSSESRFRRAVAEAIYGFTIRMTGAASYKKKRVYRS
ncbi:MAG: DUF1064 domain-containing protein [Patescibacteria group bacterium]|nr:DUF1064 domain-containing protein [Patescibacteria group bacterium]